MAALNFSEILEAPLFSFNELTNISFMEYIEIIKPVMIFVVGIALYSLFIFTFYRFLARRDVVKKFGNYSSKNEGFLGRVVKGLVYILENLILTPLFVFFWLIILTILMILLTRNPSANGILITSVALVAAIRITAYYNENLSQDLAKMLPFALLGIFLVDASFFSLETSITVAKQIPLLWKLLAYYFLFVIALEFILRIMHGIASIFISREESDED